MRTHHFMHIACMASLGFATPVLADETLNVKTGLWETTVTSEISGVSIPQEQLAQLPAAQRAQMEQMLKQLGVGAPRTVTEQSCVTEKDLRENSFRGAMEQSGEHCDYNEVASTRKRQEWTFSCRTDEGNATGRMTVEAASDTQVKGSMEARAPQGNMSIKFSGRWLAASCGDVD